MLRGKQISTQKHSCKCKKITLRMFSVSSAGPLDEKNATAGAGLYLGTSTVGRIVAVGFLLSRHS